MSSRDTQVRTFRAMHITYACHYHNHSQSITFFGLWEHWSGCSKPVNYIMIGQQVAPLSGPTVYPYTVIYTIDTIYLVIVILALNILGA